MVWSFWDNIWFRISFFSGVPCSSNCILQAHLDVEDEKYALEVSSHFPVTKNEPLTILLSFVMSQRFSFVSRSNFSRTISRKENSWSRDWVKTWRELKVEECASSFSVVSLRSEYREITWNEEGPFVNDSLKRQSLSAEARCFLTTVFNEKRITREREPGRFPNRFKNSLGSPLKRCPEFYQRNRSETHSQSNSHSRLRWVSYFII